MSQQIWNYSYFLHSFFFLRGLFQATFLGILLMTKSWYNLWGDLMRQVKRGQQGVTLYYLLLNYNSLSTHIMCIGMSERQSTQSTTYSPAILFSYTNSKYILTQPLYSSHILDIYNLIISGNEHKIIKCLNILLDI